MKIIDRCARYRRENPLIATNKIFQRIFFPTYRIRFAFSKAGTARWRCRHATTKACRTESRICDKYDVGYAGLVRNDFNAFCERENVRPPASGDSARRNSTIDSKRGVHPANVDDFFDAASLAAATEFGRRSGAQPAGPRIVPHFAAPQIFYFVGATETHRRRRHRRRRPFASCGCGCGSCAKCEQHGLQFATAEEAAVAADFVGRVAVAARVFDVADMRIATASGIRSTRHQHSPRDDDAASGFLFVAAQEAVHL